MNVRRVTGVRGFCRACSTSFFFLGGQPGVKRRCPGCNAVLAMEELREPPGWEYCKLSKEQQEASRKMLESVFGGDWTFGGG